MRKFIRTGKSGQCHLRPCHCTTNHIREISSKDKLTKAHWFKNSLETFFKAILGTDLGQVCKFWGVNLAPEPLKLTSFHGQIDQWSQSWIIPKYVKSQTSQMNQCAVTVNKYSVLKEKFTLGKENASLSICGQSVPLVIFHGFNLSEVKWHCHFTSVWANSRQTTADFPAVSKVKALFVPSVDIWCRFPMISL